MGKLNQRVIAEARLMLGTPFHHQARVPGVGIDCVGIPVVIAQRLGLPVKDSTDYSPETDGKVLTEALEHTCNRKPLDSAQPGDLLEFLRGRGIHHVGILTQTKPAKMIHATRNMTGGSVVEEIIPDAWARSIVAVWEVREVA